MIICPNCARENEDEYKYCLGCGTVLPRPSEKTAEPAAPAEPEVVECSNCGANIPPNFKFCGECGTPVQPQPTMEEHRAAERPTNPEPPSAVADVGETLGDLVVIRPDGTEGAKVPVLKGEVKLGRDSSYSVLESDPFLSPHHASLISDGSGHVIRDAGSLNGVFLRITAEVELQDGDYIRVGQELLRYRDLSSAEPIVAPANDPKTQTNGSPDSGYWGRLALISGPDVESRAFVFNSDEVIIGREVGDIRFRDDGFVSGKHARISRIDGRVYLKDLGSSNGTYVRIRDERRVSGGDLILMGQQLFRLEV